jgi:hypothetical protein
MPSGRPAGAGIPGPTLLVHTAVDGAASAFVSGPKANVLTTSARDAIGAKIRHPILLW